jgi:hypothetical protein
MVVQAANTVGFRPNLRQLLFTALHVASERFNHSLLVSVGFGLACSRISVVVVFGELVKRLSLVDFVSLVILEFADFT